MKFTLITGASSGIGEAFARRLAEKKHDLILVARTEDKLRSLCTELSGKHQITCHFFAIDLAGPNAAEHLYRETEKNGWTVDWLINNAGFGSSGDFATLDVEREIEMISLNVSALVSLTHLYLQKMRQAKSGTIINVSSAAGFQPIPFMATYAATKAFVSSFSEAVAEENRPFGIRVLALCPGSTKTNFFAASNIERPITVKGQQTVDQVVDTALKAVEQNKSKVVSGWTNFVGAVAGTLVPNSISSWAMAKALRKRHQKSV